MITANNPPQQLTYQQDKSGVWYAAIGEVIRLLGVCKTTIYNWTRDGISVLANEKPICKRFPRWGTHGRREPYWQLDQVNRALKALAELGKQINGHLDPSEIAKAEGITERGVKSRIEKGKIDAETILHLNKDGLPCPRTRIPSDSLKAYQLAHIDNPVPAGKMSVAVATTYLNNVREHLPKEYRTGKLARPVAENTILRWFDWCSWLKKPLTRHDGKVLTHDGQLRDAHHVERPDIEEIGRLMAIPPREIIHKDERGEWRTERQAKRAYPNISTTLLQRNRNRKHPYLNGGILSARQIPVPRGMPCNEPKIWVYLDADLKVISANSPGKGNWRKNAEESQSQCVKHGPSKDAPYHRDPVDRLEQATLKVGMVLGEKLDGIKSDTAGIKDIPVETARLVNGGTPKPKPIKPRECDEPIFAVLRAAGKRLSTVGLLDALERAGHIHGESTIKHRLGQLVEADRLTQGADQRGRGYGLPEWTNA